MADILYCRLKTITPVFIGSGKNYNINIDYKYDNNTYYFYDLSYVFSILEQKGDIQLIQKLTDSIVERNFSLEDFCKEAGIDVKKIIRDTVRIKKFTNRIGIFYRNAFGIPFIPGSSLKGAIRTALLYYYVKKGMDVKRYLPDKFVNRGADEKLLKAIFGPDPNTNIMRWLMISDAEFKKSHLQILDTRIFNVTREGYGYLQLMGRGQKENHKPQEWYRGTPNIQEMLQKESISAPFTIKFDNYLAEHLDELFDNAKKELPENIITILKEYAGTKIQEEKQFFQNYGHKNAEKFYDHLENELHKLNANQTFIRVGWGGGWNFMTGNFLDEQAKAKIKRIFNLGKRDVTEFPKSRKLVVEDNREPSIPPGWLLLEVIERDEALKLMKDYHNESNVEKEKPPVNSKSEAKAEKMDAGTSLSGNFFDHVKNIQALHELKLFIMKEKNVLSTNEELKKALIKKIDELISQYGEKSKEAKELLKIKKSFI